MNTIVNLAISKLLKEKGFNEKCWHIYTITGLEQIAAITGVDYTGYSNEELTSSIAAPTIGQTVMWLYEKHGIWIGVNKDTSVKWINDYFNFYIQGKNGESAFSDVGGTQPNSPTEAYENGIKYCLDNLI